MRVKVFDQNGKEVGQTLLPKEIFGLEPNADLLYQVIRAQAANKRQVSAHAKGRGEVRGGGIKPWKQKGTGRARHGSIRSPLWVGGGVSHGPTKERNFKQKINVKMARKALFVALSSKAKDNEILVLEDLKLQNPKTKEMNQVISNLRSQIADFKDLNKNMLLILPVNDDNIVRASKNLPYLSTILARNLNALAILSYKYLLMLKEDVKVLKETFLGKSDKNKLSLNENREEKVLETSNAK